MAVGGFVVLRLVEQGNVVLAWVLIAAGAVVLPICGVGAFHRFSLAEILALIGRAERIVEERATGERLEVSGGAECRALASTMNRILESFEESERAVVDRETRLRAVFSNAAVGLAVIGSEGTFEQVNQRWAEMLGYRPEELIGNAGMDVIHPDDLLEALPNLDGQDLREMDLFHIEARCQRKDDTVIWADIAASGIRGPEGELAAIILIAADITDLKRAQEELAALSRTDALTGLANRRAFEDVADKEWRRSMRNHSQLGVLLCDVDHFKTYNDAYGHLAGDECLKAIAQVLLGSFREGVDLPARWGGEEFAVILVDTDEESVRACAERMRARVEQANLERPGQSPDRVTISVGAVCSPALSELDHAALFAAADEALYKAKSSGRNCVVFGTPPVPSDTKA
jgi:diguanylate cyclase (GGDEF)-like protein/PAS domain S-box-containing protein